MPAAGRRTMPRPAVGVRPSASFYAPAVPRGLRLCREGCGGLAFYVRDVRRRVGRLDFRAPAVPRGLRRARLLHSRRAPQGGPIGLSRSRRTARFAAGAPSTFATCAVRALVFHSLRQFFPDVHIDSFAPHRPPARGHGGGAVFSRRERTIAHGHARTARFGGASGHSRGRICPAPRRGFATLCPLAPPMVGGLGGATAAPDAGAGTRGDFDPPRQPTRRFLGLCARRPRRRRPPPCRQCRHLPPLDARAPPLAAPAADSGGGLRTFPHRRPADSSGCGVSHGASSGRPRACFPSRRCRSHRRAFVGGDKGIKCTVNLRERVVFHIFAV